MTTPPEILDDADPLLDDRADAPGARCREGASVGAVGSLLREPKFSITQAAKLAGIGRTTLRTMIGDGTLPSVKLRDKHIILGRDLERMLRENYSGDPLGETKDVHRNEQPTRKPERPHLPEDVLNSKHLM